MNSTKANRKRRLARVIFNVTSVIFLLTVMIVFTHASASAVSGESPATAPVAIGEVVKQKDIPSTLREVHKNITKKQAEISKILLPPTKKNATNKLTAARVAAKSTSKETSASTSSSEPKVNGPQKNHLTRSGGTFNGPSGKETYYNLNMSGVVRIMQNMGYNKYSYWVRDDGAKMFGPYIMVAANLEIRPRGTILETSLGTAMVCDTGTFAQSNPRQIDIAANW